MFTFQLSPAEVFAERTRQFLGAGVPKETLRRVRNRVADMWQPGPGGWCTEWSNEAQAFERAGAWLDAARCYGVARFPIVNTEERRIALQNQTRTFLTGAPDFPCSFERLMLEYDALDGSKVQAPVHLYGPRRERANILVVLSGGVDTGKTELHRLALLLVKLGGFAVAALDMPGTGESGLPLTADADAVYAKVIGTLSERRKVGIWGISFGGHFAAKLALRGLVDCAVDHGGPIGVNRDGSSILSLPYGMAGTLCNARGLPALPSHDAAESVMQDFSLESLGLNRPRVPAPLLVLNGADDQYIPRADSLVFAGKENAEVLLVPGATHCAAEVFPRLVPTVVAWLGAKLGANKLRVALVGVIGKAVAPAFERHPLTSAIPDRAS